MLQSFSWTSKLWKGWAPSYLGIADVPNTAFIQHRLLADAAAEHTVEGLQVSDAIGMSENPQNGEKTWKVRCHRQFDLCLILADLKLCRERLLIRCFFTTQK